MKMKIMIFRTLKKKKSEKNVNFILINTQIIIAIPAILIPATFIFVFLSIIKIGYKLYLQILMRSLNE